MTHRQISDKIKKNLIEGRATKFYAMKNVLHMRRLGRLKLLYNSDDKILLLLRRLQN